MIILSKILYFISHYGFYTIVLIILLFGSLAHFTRRALFLIAIIPLSIANGFASQYLNAWFLNRYGVRSTAIITSDVETNSTLNDAYIHDYGAIVMKQNGKYINTDFSTTSAAIYPIENSIQIPPKGQSFPVKYIPGFEKNIVILYYESKQGQSRLRFEKQEPINSARIKYEADPSNNEFIEEYLKALKDYTEQYNDENTTAYQLKIMELQRALAVPK